MQKRSIGTSTKMEDDGRVRSYQLNNSAINMCLVVSDNCHFYPLFNDSSTPTYLDDSGRSGTSLETSIFVIFCQF